MDAVLEEPSWSLAELPHDMLDELGSHLDPSAIFSLAFSCSTLFSFFKYRILSVTQVSEIASSSGCAPLLRYLVEERGLASSLSARCGENAILGGHLLFISTLFQIAPKILSEVPFIPDYKRKHAYDGRPWFAAGASGDLKMISFLLRISVNKGYPKFMEQAFYLGLSFGGHLDVVSSLTIPGKTLSPAEILLSSTLETSAKIDKIGYPFDSLMTEYAMRGGQHRSLAWIQEMGIARELTYRDMDWAARSGNPDLVDLLCSRGFDITNSVIQNATASGSIPLLELLSRKQTFRYSDLLGYAVLDSNLIAIKWICLRDSQLFRSNNVTLNKHYACAALKGNVQLFKLLLSVDFSDANAKRSHFAKFGKTYFENGVESGHTDILRYFKIIKCGWEGAQKNEHRLLEKAMASGSRFMARFLVDEVFASKS